MQSHDCHLCNHHEIPFSMIMTEAVVTTHNYNDIKGRYEEFNRESIHGKTDNDIHGTDILLCDDSLSLLCNIASIMYIIIDERGWTKVADAILRTAREIKLVYCQVVIENKI